MLRKAEAIANNEVLCKNCDNYFKGHRYVCIVCDDYTLCGPCEFSENVHTHHTMLRLGTDDLCDGNDNPNIVELSRNLWNRTKRSLKSKFQKLKIRQFCDRNIFQKLRGVASVPTAEWTETNSDIELFPIRSTNLDAYGDDVYVAIPAMMVEDCPAQCVLPSNSGASKYQDNWTKFDDSDGNILKSAGHMHSCNNEVLTEVHSKNKPINLIVNDSSNVSKEMFMLTETFPKTVETDSESLINVQVEHNDNQEKEHLKKINCNSEDDWILLE